jgi:hypothetical protein
MSDTPVNNGPGIKMPPYKVAFIIDGKVEDIIHTEDRLAAIMLSNPIIVDVTDIWEGHGGPNMVGMFYTEADGTFSRVILD